MDFLVTIILITWATLVGLVCGSFANVMVHRLPRGVFFSMGSRSCCPICGTLITWIDNIPLVSYLFLQGRCRACKAPIPLRYPLVELAGGLLFFLVAWQAWGPRELGLGFALLGFFLSLWLLAGSVIDMEHRILPDTLTLSGLVMAPGLVFLNPLAAGDWPGEVVSGSLGFLLWCGAGILTGGGALWLTGLFGRVAFHKEAMGFGDVKLMAFLGGILGPTGVLISFFLACLGGALIGVCVVFFKKDNYLPFGPYLAGASLAVFLWKQEVMAGLASMMTTMSQGPTEPIYLLILALLGALFLVILRRSKRVSDG